MKIQVVSINELMRTPKSTQSDLQMRRGRVSSVLCSAARDIRHASMCLRRASMRSTALAGARPMADGGRGAVSELSVSALSKP